MGKKPESGGCVGLRDLACCFHEQFPVRLFCGSERSKLLSLEFFFVPHDVCLGHGNSDFVFASFFCFVLFLK